MAAHFYIVTSRLSLNGLEAGRSVSGFLAPRRGAALTGLEAGRSVSGILLGSTRKKKEFPRALASAPGRNQARGLGAAEPGADATEGHLGHLLRREVCDEAVAQVAGRSMSMSRTAVRTEWFSTALTPQIEPRAE